MNSYVSLDLETTGLEPKLDKIIEIGAVKVIDGEIVDKFSTFVNPCRKLSKNTTELTGITEDDLKTAKEIKEVLPDLLDFLENLPLLGHRIMFDYSFVKHAATNASLPFEKEGVDTLKISRICHLELPSKKLTDMCAYYGIEYKAHRALNDAEATARLYEQLKERYSEKNPELFSPKALIYKVKKEGPIRASQIVKIKELIQKHKLDCPYEVEKLTRNEAARYIDKINSEYGIR